MTEPVRLAKRVAEIVPCSRREAEIYIEGGWVTVDGKVIEEPQFRVGAESVVLHPHAKLAEPEPVTILLHSQNGTNAASPAIGIDNHASDDASGIKPLKRHFSRLAPTLPLQTDASGLVVLTQDWRVSRKLVDSAATVEQEYVVEVAADVSPETLKQLNRRVTLGGRELPAAKVSLQSERRLRVALKGTHTGHIAQMCLNADVQIVSVKRIRIGRIAMAKLPPGQWRYLPLDERF
jgi:23S rRNA pseudouridine2604 synthase